MPPNVQNQDLEENVTFVNSFWSKDKSGMNKLFTYIKATHDDLDIIYSIYTQRAQLEQEFGEKLLSLSTIQGNKDEENDGVAAAYSAIAMELKHTAESHLDLSQKLSAQVAAEFEQKVEDYKLLMEKWTSILNELYDERLDKTTELLKIRTKYLKEHEVSKGQPTPKMEMLKNQYKSLVAEVDEVSQEWNKVWIDACEVMEAMEEDRVEFIKANMWEYANLASARLLVEDEWCETIRQKLEVCNVEDEIERCVSMYGTGTKVPTTNEYVGEQMKEFKKKISSANAPVLPVKPSRKQEDNKGYKPKQQEEAPVPKPRRLVGSQESAPLTKPRKQHYVEEQQEDDRSSVQENQEEAPKPNPRQRHREHQEDDRRSVQEEEAPKPKPRQRNRQQQEVMQPKDHIENRRDANQERPYNQADDGVEESHNTYSKQSSSRQNSSPEHKAFDTNAKQLNEVNDSTRNISPSTQHRTYGRADEERMKHIRNSVSDNIGSTASRGQIKRKPLNKSLMDQVSNQMAMARQQRELEQEEMNRSSYEGSVQNKDDDVSSHKRTNSNGSLESLLQTFEVVSPIKKTQSPPPNAVVSEEARSRRQPSEYKPDTGSISSRRGNMSNSNKKFPHQINTAPPSNQEELTHPIAQANNGPPKSPRPPSQQISAEVAQQAAQESFNNDPRQQSQQQQQQHFQNPQHYNQPQSSMMGPQQGQDGNMYVHHQQYSGQPQYMGHSQHMGPPSPMMQPHHSPMMQPQRSPMMQAQRSPMMQHSPMMQAPRSPMMAPSPMMQPAQAYPLSINIPTSINYGVTPQPSPSMSYNNASIGAISPGGVLPPPAVGSYNQPARPAQYSDGRPILFWARAKYDYMATDQGEISLNANNLVGVLEADMTQPSWWVGAIWDEYRQTWSIAGSIPSNFMANA